MNAICNSFRPWLVTAGGQKNTSALEIHATCIPVIGVHEIHGRVAPIIGYGNKFVCTCLFDPLTHPPEHHINIEQLISFAMSVIHLYPSSNITIRNIKHQPRISIVLYHRTSSTSRWDQPPQLLL